LTMSGCGGGGGSSSASQQAATGTAFYVDSAVEGVTVTCGNTVSVTDENGMFTFEAGRECRFTIGGILLRVENELYQDKVIVEDSIKTAQFLQSMDSDGNPDNGIKIMNQTGDVMVQYGISQVPDNDEELADAVEAMESSASGYYGSYVGGQEAENHLEKTKSQYYGEEPAQPQQPSSPQQPQQPQQPEQPQEPQQPSSPQKPQQPSSPQQPQQQQFDNPMQH